MWWCREHLLPPLQLLSGEPRKGKEPSPTPRPFAQGSENILQMSVMKGRYTDNWTHTFQSTKERAQLISSTTATNEKIRSQANNLVNLILGQGYLHRYRIPNKAQMANGCSWYHGTFGVINLKPKSLESQYSQLCMKKTSFIILCLDKKIIQISHNEYVKSKLKILDNNPEHLGENPRACTKAKHNDRKLICYFSPYKAYILPCRLMQRNAKISIS